jgi:hypothetical protein
MKKTGSGAIFLAALSLAGCGGGGGSGSSNASGGSQLALSGWYVCGTSTGANVDEYQNPVAILATPHGALYGSCNTANGITVNVSGNYSGTIGDPPGSSSPYIAATLTNVLFYSLTPNTGKPATTDPGTPVPADSYSSTSGGETSSTEYLSFSETGTASKAGLIDTFTIPTTLQLTGPASPSSPPATAGGYAGSYSTAPWVVYVTAPLTSGTTTNSTVGVPLSRTAPEVFSGSVSLAIDSSGDLSGTTPAGTLSGTVSAYDPTTGIAEYTGTLTTSAGSTPVNGAYASNDYQLTVAPPDATGPFAFTAYTPVALFVKGSGFEYEFLLQQA